MILSGKNTKITMLYSDRTRNSPWPTVNQTHDVDQALVFAEREFGPGGTQAGRRWFYRIRDEFDWSEFGKTTTKWRQVPRIRQWCDIYFRDPRDATWFSLKKDSLSSQMS